MPENPLPGEINIGIDTIRVKTLEKFAPVSLARNGLAAPQKSQKTPLAVSGKAMSPHTGPL